MLKLPSNNVGLSNMAAKYKLLDAPQMFILETNESFTIQIPLLKHIPNKNTNRRRLRIGC